MGDELLRSIEDLGLSQKEARVYVANLTLGPATVQKIADQADIKRVTTYVILESLAGLGLVSQSNQGKKTLFTAEDPISLRRLIDKKQQQIKDQKASFENILPELQGLKNLPTDSPSVKFYEGAEGIRSIFNSFFDSHKADVDMVFGISNLDQLHAFFPELENVQGNPARLKAGIPSKFLYTSSRGPIFKDTDKTRNRESRYVPPDKHPLNGDITIVGNRLLLLSLTSSKPIGVTIESAELAKAIRSLFFLAWESAEKYNKS